MRIGVALTAAMFLVLLLILSLGVTTARAQTGCADLSGVSESVAPGSGSRLTLPRAGPG
jgi:hypothetical protein